MYRNLVKIIKTKENSGVPIPVPINNEWTSFAYVTGYYGNVHISYFSDTFIIWTDYIERGLSAGLFFQLSKLYSNSCCMQSLSACSK